MIILRELNLVFYQGLIENDHKYLGLWLGFSPTTNKTKLLTLFDKI